MSAYLEQMYTADVALVRLPCADRIPPVKLYMTCAEMAGSTLLPPRYRRYPDTVVKRLRRYSQCEVSAKLAPSE
jgi:hypothetical protein